jgi:hypothetical protein
LSARRLAAAAGLALACATAPPYELPEERGASRPLREAANPRTGEITWRSGTLEQTPDRVRIGFTLVNGTSRDYVNVMLRLVLRGVAHETATARYPVGRLAARSSKVVQAFLGPPGFEGHPAGADLGPGMKPRGDARYTSKSSGKARQNGARWPVLAAPRSPDALAIQPAHSGSVSPRPPGTGAGVPAARIRPKSSAHESFVGQATARGTA